MSDEESEHDEAEEIEGENKSGHWSLPRSSLHSSRFVFLENEGGGEEAGGEEEEKSERGEEEVEEEVDTDHPIVFNISQLLV